MLKSRIGYNVVKQLFEREKQNQLNANQDSCITREQVVEMYNVIKRCVKDNGHFNLVEVESHDGEKVLIRV